MNLFIDASERNDWPNYYDSPELLRSRIECYSTKLINSYDPVFIWDFALQIEKWLENVEDIEDKFFLVNTLNYFTFFNREQCHAIYQEALDGAIKRWLIDIKGYSLFNPDLSRLISEDINSTLFSAATDMDLSAFTHANELTPKYRTTWFDFISSGSDEAENLQKVNLFRNNMSRWNYSQIVVLEDFVGSGKQIEGTLDFLGQIKEYKVIVVPLITCPQGDYSIRAYLEQEQYTHISYEPVVVLPWDLMLSNERPPNALDTPQLLKELTAFAQSNHSKIIGDHMGKKPDYLGYGNVGALFCKYTNCPNNTLPLYWFSSEASIWKPLFKRIERISNA